MILEAGGRALIWLNWIQADMYKYVLQSYLKNVPAVQRYGVTVWGSCRYRQLVNPAAAPDIPLLFDENYKNKFAFAGFIQGLK